MKKSCDYGGPRHDDGRGAGLPWQAAAASRQKRDVNAKHPRRGRAAHARHATMDASTVSARTDCYGCHGANDQANPMLQRIASRCLRTITRTAVRIRRNSNPPARSALPATCRDSESPSAPSARRPLDAQTGRAHNPPGPSLSGPTHGYRKQQVRRRGASW